MSNSHVLRKVLELCLNAITAIEEDFLDVVPDMLLLFGFSPQVAPRTESGTNEPGSIERRFRSRILRASVPHFPKKMKPKLALGQF